MQNPEQFITRINNILLNLWQKYNDIFEEVSNDFNGEQRIRKYFLPGLIHKLPEKCELLFLGINPSYSSKGWLNLLGDHNEHEDVTQNGENGIDDFFLFRSVADALSKMDEIEKMEQLAQRHQYFSKFYEIKNEVLPKGKSDNWGHLDMFYIRERSADKIKAYIKIQELSRFFYIQKLISKKVIEFLKPKIIVIANAYTTGLFKELFIITKDSIPQRFNNELRINKNFDYKYVLKYEGKNDLLFRRLKNGDIKLKRSERDKLWLDYITDKYFKKRLGTYQISIANKPTIIFCSGILSGEWALDSESYYRLKWHINKLYSNYCKFRCK